MLARLHNSSFIRVLSTSLNGKEMKRSKAMVIRHQWSLGDPNARHWCQQPQGAPANQCDTLGFWWNTNAFSYVCRYLYIFQLLEPFQFAADHSLIKFLRKAASNTCAFTFSFPGKKPFDISGCWAAQRSPAGKTSVNQANPSLNKSTNGLHNFWEETARLKQKRES